MTDPVLDAMSSYNTAANVGLAIFVSALVIGWGVVLWSVIGRRGFD